MLSNLLSALEKSLFKPLNKVTGTSMSVHNGFMLWTLILLFNFIRFVCGEQVLCLLTFCLIASVGYDDILSRYKVLRSSY